MVVPRCDENDEEDERELARRAKRQRKEVEAQYLETGASVLYWDGWRAAVHEAFEPLDTYWLADEDTGKVLRDEYGEIRSFKSNELQVVAPPPRLDIVNDFAPKVGVFILGTAQQMRQVMEHFGLPDGMQRTEPQELLAIPCNMCEASTLIRTARKAMNPTTKQLAQEQRPDLHVALRSYQLREAVNKCKALLRLEEHFCLAGLNVPFGLEQIEESQGKEQRKYRRNIANQIDMCVTAYGDRDGTHDTLMDAAQQALGKSCGICLSEVLWKEEVQNRIRKMLGVSDLPLSYEDALGAKIFVILLPADASITEEEGILSFFEAYGSEYMAAPAEPVKEVKEEDAADVKPEGDEAENPADQPREKTVKEWEAEQEKFGDQPKLPAGWIRVMSRKSGKTYYYNKETQESSFEVPLPEGWTMQVSKSNGRTYYFHPQKKISTFVRPGGGD